MSKAPSAILKQAIEAFQRGALDEARALVEQDLAARPSANGEHLLGLIHCRVGAPEAGVPHLRNAVRLDPGNAAFHVMLARALVDAGSPEEVLEMAEPPPIASPATLALWQSRAEAAGSAGNLDAAAAAWRKIAAASPADWRAWSNFGNALAANDQWVEASSALAEAARLNPAEASVRANAIAALMQAGRVHQGQLRFDDAEAAFRHAHALDPANAAVVQQLGIALERTSRLDALAALVEEAAGAGIADGQLDYLRAVLARRAGRLDEAHQLLLRSDAQDDPVRWQSMRAKIADALGNPAEAFAAATAMNEAAVAQAVGSGDRAAWEQDTRDYRAELRELARMITPEWAARVPRLEDPPGKRLSFLLGFPRSGTTLLDTFLMGHRDVEVLEEKQIVANAAEVVGGSAGLAGASMKRLRLAREAYFRALREHVSADFGGLVVDKFPLDMAAAPVIEAVFPGAPIIFAQRHPCDVVLSGFMQPIGVVNFSNIEAAADYYDAMMGIWTAAHSAMSLRVHTVVYEELVRDPEAALRPLLEFLGLDWEDGLLDHQRTAKARGTIVTPTYDQVTEPITTAASGRWKRYRAQLEPVLPILLQWAERLGYAD